MLGRGRRVFTAQRRSGLGKHARTRLPRGILNVGAEDKGTGKSESITITNDKGRLTEEQIERMIKEAEEFAEEDKKVKERIDGRNALGLTTADGAGWHGRRRHQRPRLGW